MTNSHPEGLTPDIEALTRMHEIQIVGLANKHNLPILQVAEQCTNAVNLLFQKLEDATEIIVMHATTPSPDIPLTIVDDIRYESPSTGPFFLMQSKICNYLTIDDLVIEEAIVEEALDADAEENGIGMDNRIMIADPNIPEFTFAPDPETIPPPPDYIGPTPTPADRLSYSEFIALTKTCSTPTKLTPSPSRVATPPFSNPTIFKQLINQTLRGPFAIKDPTILTPTPTNKQSPQADPELTNMIVNNE